MSIFRRLIDAFAPQQSAPVTGVVMSPEEKASMVADIMVAFDLGYPQWSEIDLESTARATYIQNAIGYRCLKLIATAGSTLPLMLTGRRGRLIDEHPLLTLLMRPNPMMGQQFFFEALMTYHLLAGEVFIEGVGTSKGGYNELWVHRPDRVNPVPGALGIPSRYEYEHNGQNRSWDVDVVSGRADLLHLRAFHPINDWRGLGRSEAARRASDRVNKMAEHSKALLDNGARPSGALIFKPSQLSGGMGVQHASPQVMEEAEKALERRHSGARNAGRPMVLGGDVVWQNFGLSPTDMGLSEEKKDASRDVCLSWGVPPVLVIGGESTYNNMQDGKLQLYEETVLPAVELALGELNHWLQPVFGDDLLLKVDKDQVSALEPRRVAKRSSVTNLLDKGVIDADEARDELDYGPRPVDSVREFDGTRLKALVDGAEIFGITPLHRYMLSVGLIAPGTTEKDLLNAALDLVAEDDEDDEGDDDFNDTDTQTEDTSQ